MQKELKTKVQNLNEECKKLRDDVKDYRIQNEVSKNRGLSVC